MKAGEWTEAHSALMETAAEDAASGEVDLDATWDQVARRINAAPKRRSHRRAVAIVAASAVLAGGGTAAAAAAGLFSSHTGEYATGRDVGRAGPGEFLDPSGEDFPAVTLEETADIPFPSEQARSISAQFQIDDHPGGWGQLTTGALRGFVANDAICSWSNAWAGAVADGDDVAAQIAGSALQAADDWPAVRALDTELTTRTTEVHLTDGTVHTVDDPTRFYYLRQVQKAVAAGDVDALASALNGKVFCIPALMPELPQAVPTLDGGARREALRRAER